MRREIMSGAFAVSVAMNAFGVYNWERAGLSIRHGYDVAKDVAQQLDNCMKRQENTRTVFRRAFVRAQEYCNKAESPDSCFAGTGWDTLQAGLP